MRLSAVVFSINHSNFDRRNIFYEELISEYWTDLMLSAFKVKDN